MKGITKSIIAVAAVMAASTAVAHPLKEAKTYPDNYVGPWEQDCLGWNSKCRYTIRPIRDAEGHHGEFKVVYEFNDGLLGPVCRFEGRFRRERPGVLVGKIDGSDAQVMRRRDGAWVKVRSDGVPRPCGQPEDGQQLYVNFDGTWPAAR